VVRAPAMWLAARLPHLALDLLTRADDLKRALPIAVSDADPRQPRILDCNPAATRHGVRPGLAVGAARAVAEGLRVTKRDPGTEACALERLAAWSYQYSSLVSVRPQSQALLLEAGASRRLFGPAAGIAVRMTGELQQLGYHACTGTAPTPEAALLAARLGTHVPDHAALAALLRDLPLHRLDLDTAQATALEAMGFRRAGDLLRLPRKALARRLGPALVDYLDRLTGARPDPQKAWRPPARFSAGLELPAEIVTSQGLLFPLKRLAGELCGILRAGDCGVQELHIHLRSRDAAQDLRLGFASPCRDETRMVLLLRERLERVRLPRPVSRIRLYADRFLPFTASQPGLLESGGGARSAPEPLLERLQARLGERAVTGLRGVQDHRPEYSWALRAPHDPADCAAMPHRPVWLLGRPWPCRMDDYRILAGPERIESGWWDGHDCRRDYFVVRDAWGSTLWAYREYKPDNGWFIQGIFA